VARHEFDKSEEDEDRAPSPGTPGYFAALVMDGDEMGKWLNGKHPTLPLDADGHRKLSARLSEFALKHARGIVRGHDGCLVYAGGDDVLALLPADTALACASDLRSAFRKVLELDIDASVGVAIAHFTEPLQDVVRAAQDAEKRAKNQGNRGSLAVSLFKRSGETVHWHCKWPSVGRVGSGLGLFETLRGGLAAARLSARFPHRVGELLLPYLLDPAEPGRHLLQAAEQFDFRKIARREFTHVLGRQHGPKWEPCLEVEVRAQLAGYLDQLDEFRDAQGIPLQNNDKLRALLGLCQTVAFINRNDTKRSAALAAEPPQNPLKT
jgi:CRISPR-associated protein Cmr2